MTYPRRKSSTRTLCDFGQLTVAQTRLARWLWRNGALAVSRAENRVSSPRVIASLINKKVITKTKDGKFYILTDDAALSVAIWLRDNPGFRF